jgi:hypothetical protein
VSMDNRKVIYTVAIASAMTIAFIGCKPKYSEIDNNQVISKPYVLYAGDSLGGNIYKSNDGFTYQTVIAGEGYPAFSIVTSGQNMLFIKKNVHYVVNPQSEGLSNSNPSLPLPAGPPPGSERSIMISIPQWGNRVYLGGIGPKGLMRNDSNGVPGVGGINWRPVADTFMATPGLITSMTFLDEGSLIAFDDGLRRFYRMSDQNGQFSPNTSGNGLPAGRHFFISHIANTVLAADNADSGKLYYSTDYGANFTPYDGLPVDARITTVDAPFNQTILVGTRNHGVYRLPLGSTTFVPSSLGLPASSHVTCILSKYDFFKNNRSKQYTYTATNKGIYRSEDNGENWVKVLDGNFVTLY